MKTSVTAKAFPVYYDHQKKVFYREDAHGCWIQINESTLKRHLALKYKLGKKAIPTALEWILDTNTISFAGPLAGYSKGIHQMCGNKILVTESPELITPIACSWDVVRAILEGLLSDPHHDQLLYLKSWLKLSLEALAAGATRPGQAIAIVGPKDCGKSFLQNILTQLLGGRSAVPYQYMTGQTPFNRDLIGAEHLMVEDNDARTDIKSRRTFGSAVKVITVNEDQRLHAKGRDAVMVRPFWRLSITVNDEPENMMLLPPLDDSLADKIMIFRARHFTLPMPTVTLDDRQRIQSQIKKELPGFVWHLFEEFVIPPALESRRFGVVHFHHPALVASLWDLDPEKRLLSLIDQCIIDKPSWIGSAEELEKVLLEGPGQHEVRRVLSWNNAAGTFLGRLAKKYPNRILHGSGRLDGQRKWEIVHREVADAEAAFDAPRNETSNHPATHLKTYSNENESMSQILENGGRVERGFFFEWELLSSLVKPEAVMPIDEFVEIAKDNCFCPIRSRQWAIDYANGGSGFVKGKGHVPF